MKSNMEWKRMQSESVVPSAPCAVGAGEFNPVVPSAPRATENLEIKPVLPSARQVSSSWSRDR